MVSGGAERAAGQGRKHVSEREVWVLENSQAIPVKATLTRRGAKPDSRYGLRRVRYVPEVSFSPAKPTTLDQSGITTETEALDEQLLALARNLRAAVHHDLSYEDEVATLHQALKQARALTPSKPAAETEALRVALRELLRCFAEETQEGDGIQERHFPFYERAFALVTANQALTPSKTAPCRACGCAKERCDSFTLEQGPCCMDCFHLSKVEPAAETEALISLRKLANGWDLVTGSMRLEGARVDVCEAREGLTEELSTLLDTLTSGKVEPAAEPVEGRWVGKWRQSVSPSGSIRCLTINTADGHRCLLSLSESGFLASSATRAEVIQAPREHLEWLLSGVPPAPDGDSSEES